MVFMMAEFKKQERSRSALDHAYPVMGISLSIVLLAIYGLTFSVSPLNGEDFALSRFASGSSFTGTIVWVVDRSAHQIMGWNARLGEQLAIFWMAMPSPWFTAASVVTFAVFCWSVTAIARRTVKFDQAFLMGWIVANSLCWLVWPRMEIFFWRTATAEYLQPLVLTLLLSLVFVAKDFRAIVMGRSYSFVAVAIVAFLAGLSFENVPPALLAFFGWRLMRIRHEGGEKLRNPGALVCVYALGWIALMVFPSTRFRFNYYQAQFHSPAMSVAYLVGRANRSVDILLSSSPELLILFTCCVLVGVLKPSLSGRRSLDTVEFLFPGIVSFAGTVVAPYTEPRAFSLLWVVMLIYVVWTFCQGDAAVHSITRKVSALVLPILALGMAAGVYGEYAKFGAEADRRIDTIVASTGREACLKGIEVPRLTTDASPRILNNRDEWVVGNYSQVNAYFGCKVIVK